MSKIEKQTSRREIPHEILIAIIAIIFIAIMFPAIIIMYRYPSLTQTTSVQEIIERIPSYSEQRYNEIHNAVVDGMKQTGVSFEELITEYSVHDGHWEKDED